MHNEAVVYPRALCSLSEEKMKWGSGGWCSRKRNDAMGACHSLQDSRIPWGLQPTSWASLAVKEIKAIRQENGNRLRGCAQSMVVNALFWNVRLHSCQNGWNRGGKWQWALVLENSSSGDILVQDGSALTSTILCIKSGVQGQGGQLTFFFSSGYVLAPVKVGGKTQNDQEP